jgi:hypothetical protein
VVAGTGAGSGRVVVVGTTVVVVVVVVVDDGARVVTGDGAVSP